MLEQVSLATCFSLSIACSVKQFLTLLSYCTNLKPALAICVRAVTLLLFVLKFISLEKNREKISKAEGNDSLFNWEICLLVKRIDNSTNSQLDLSARTNQKFQLLVSLRSFFSLVWTLARFVELRISCDNTDVSSSFCHQVDTLHWATRIKKVDAGHHEVSCSGFKLLFYHWDFDLFDAKMLG